MVIIKLKWQGKIMLYSKGIKIAKLYQTHLLLSGFSSIFNLR
jgi:hypothetical protein